MAPTVGIPIVDFLLGLIAQHGYLITLLATIMENLFIVGMPTPGEVFVMAAGFVSSSGAISPWLVGVSSVTGTFIGSNFTYFLGRHGGRPLLDRYGHRYRINPDRIAAAEEFFEKHGSKTLVLARFAAGIKNFAPMVAGVSRMPILVFEAYTLLGAVIYTSLMVVLGYFFGENLPVLAKIVGRMGYVGLALVIGLLAAFLYGRHRYSKRRIEELAEEREDEEGREREQA